MNMHFVRLIEALETFVIMWTQIMGSIYLANLEKVFKKTDVNDLMFWFALIFLPVFISNFSNIILFD